jgi:hypothetical protein
LRQGLKEAKEVLRLNGDAADSNGGMRAIAGTPQGFTRLLRYALSVDMPASYDEGSNVAKLILFLI